jgi:hypothetical protein
VATFYQSIDDVLILTKNGLGYSSGDFFFKNWVNLINAHPICLDKASFYVYTYLPNELILWTLKHCREYPHILVVATWPFPAGNSVNIYTFNHVTHFVISC